MVAITITSIICITILLLFLIPRYFDYKERIKGLDSTEEDSDSIGDNHLW